MLKISGRRLLIGMCIFVIALTSSGCSLGTDVWTLLRTPHLTGEQEKVQTALDAYLKSTPKDDTAGGAYVLKYPKSGDYRSAFILKDLDGDGQEEAIAFYSRGPEGSNVHINLLRQVDSKWQSVSDIEGTSADIERVRFGDLNGDGTMELMVGWNIDNMGDKQLALYSITDGAFSIWDQAPYSAAVVGDLTSCGHDNLLLIYASTSDNITTAQLWTLQYDSTTQKTVLSKHDSIPIDGYIQQFGNAQIGKLSGTLNGAYVDGIRSSGGMVTELVYWDGTKLCAPLYVNNKNVTLREALIPSCDIDGDGVVEWPKVQKLDGYSPTSDADMLWLTDWYSLDLKSQSDTQEITKKFTCILNMADGYYLRFDDWNGQYTATFDSQSHLFKLYNKQNTTEGNEILILRTTIRTEANRTTTETTDSSPVVQDTHVYKVLMDDIPSLPNVRYDVWYSGSQANFNMESIRYMFGLFNQTLK